MSILSEQRNILRNICRGYVIPLYLEVRYRNVPITLRNDFSGYELPKTAKLRNVEQLWACTPCTLCGAVLELQTATFREYARNERRSSFFLVSRVQSHHNAHTANAFEDLQQWCPGAYATNFTCSRIPELQELGAGRSGIKKLV